MPAVVLRNRDKLGPRTGAIYAYALRVRTKMTATGQTIATVPTGDVSLAHDEIAARKAFYVIADTINSADKLVTDRHRHGNRLLRPSVPIVDVHVSPADGSFQHAD